MSHIAIAAALALEDVSAGERLTAFSLASFANREHTAWPGTRVAAARAGLSRSQYLAARDGLQKRSMIAVEESAGGRGHSPIITLRFAETGPWFEGEINAPLFETTLGYSRARGSARVLLATLAAIADERLEVSGLATEVIRDAAGMADSTYRRARAALLASGDVLLEAAGGGRARTNRWLVCDPRSINPEPAVVQRGRVAPGALARPLMAAAKEPPAGAACREEAPQTRGREGEKGPELSGVSGLNPSQNRTVCAGKGPELSGVSELNPSQNRTLSPETPPQTPPETPPPNVRAGREPQNPRTSPPNPPDGGSGTSTITIVEDYITDRGRRRQRAVTVDLDSIRSQLVKPDAVDRSHWDQIRAELNRRAGDSVFELWLSQLELAAVDEAGSLVLACPPPARGWVVERYGRLLEVAGRSVDRQLKLASDREMQLLAALADAPCSEPTESPRVVVTAESSGAGARDPAPGRRRSSPFGIKSCPTTPTTNAGCCPLSPGGITMTKIPDANGVDHTQSSPREPARALLRACGRHGYRAEPDSPVLASAELGELNVEQLDGLTCAFCGGREGAMVPISRGPELFIHAEECPSTTNQSSSAPNREGSLGIALDCLAEQCSIEQLAAARVIADELEDEEAAAQLGYLIEDKEACAVRSLPEQDNYSRRAAAAIVYAARGEHDFGGWLGEVLATAAAELGSTAALTSGRPGSWEADLVQRLVRGTVGWEDEYLRDYRHAPPAIGETS